MERESSPEMRITAIPPLPFGVEIAAIDDENIEYIIFSYFENEAECPPRFDLLFTVDCCLKIL